MRVEERQLLLAVHEIVGVVDVEHDALGRRRVAPAEEIDEADADPFERAPVSEVLEPRQRRLAHQIEAALGRSGRRRSAARDRCAAHRGRRILMAGRDRHHARRHHLGVGVDDAHRIAVVGERRGDASARPSRSAISRKHDDTAVRGQQAGIDVAVSDLPATGDRPGRNGVACGMASGDSGGTRTLLLRHQNPTPIQRLRRRPSISLHTTPE